MNLKHRSYQKEILDEDCIPFADIRQNMKELNFINTWLGGHRITIAGFRSLAADKKELSVCEIGCGGGDNLIAIARWCKQKDINLNITGIDIKKECIDFAKSRFKYSRVNWIVDDYSAVVFESKPDIIFSSLFCHHFTEDQLMFQFRWMKENSGVGFFVNDLQRNAMAYYSIKLLTRFFSNSYLVKNDAPVSVSRGFTATELARICNEANLKNVRIIWKWAFRYLLIHKHNVR